jgi:hypothetical protein
MVQCCGEECAGRASGERVADLRAEVDRLHAERGAAVSAARRVRMDKGVAAPEFARAWFVVEGLTRDIEEAERELQKELEADASLPHQERGGEPDASAKTPAQRAALHALAFCNALDHLSSSEACAAIDVMKARLAVSLVKASDRKAVRHA